MTVRLFVWCCLVNLLGPLGVAAQDRPAVDITQVRGNLYQVRDGAQIAVFLVTGEGIVLADPLNPDLSKRLKDELAVRFPDQPVRYVVYTKPVYERAAGAWVWTDTAQIVSQDSFQSARVRASQALPESWASLDRNQNQVLERSEAVALGDEALRKDGNKDGEITAQEAWGDVTSPKTTFHTRKVIELGGHRVELVSPGDAMGPGTTFVFFPQEQVLFAPGLVTGRTPTSFAPASPSQFVEALRQIERLEFDMVLSEHGDTNTLADVALLREYVEEMVKGVRAAVRAGDTVEQVQASLQLDRFARLDGFDTLRPRNIADAYRAYRRLTIDASGTAQFVLIQRGESSCTQSAIPTIEVPGCQPLGGPTLAGTGGVTATVGRFGGAVELSAGHRVTGSSQTFRSGTTSFQHRSTTTAFMFRYAMTSSDHPKVILTAGKARVAATEHIDGWYYFRMVSDYRVHRSAFAYTFGADVSLSHGRLNLRVPVRLLRAPTDLYWDTGGVGPKWNLSAGIGVAVPVAHLVM